MRISSFFIFVILTFDACIDPIEIETVSHDSKLTVDGIITDAPGPYTIRVFRSASVYETAGTLFPESNAKITLFDDQGNSEVLTESGPGIYETSASGMQGEMGREYHIQIETQTGEIIESAPDKINPGGVISNAEFTYNELPIPDEDKETQLWDFFDVTVDNTAEPGNKFLRWTWEGTYKAINFPQYRNFGDLCDHIQANPEPCSGYVANCAGRVPVAYPCNCRGTTSPPKAYALKQYLVKVGECSCCECWVGEYEETPLVAETSLINSFAKVKVAKIPIHSHRFADKYHIRVSVMGLSKAGYDFWKAIQSQKEAAKNLFQPPFYNIPGNLLSKNSSNRVYGIFYAASVDQRSFFIERSDIPRYVAPVDTIAYAYSCQYLANSTNQKPSFWR